MTVRNIKVMHPVQIITIGHNLVDLTNGKRVALDYPTMPVRHDVAPTSGTFRAAYRGQLITHKQVNPTLLEYEDIEAEEC